MKGFTIIFHFITIFMIISYTYCCYIQVTEFGNACADLDQYLVSRDKWGAKDPGTIECLRYPAKYIIIHHTVTPPCNDSASCSDACKKLQKEHMEDKKWPDIGYQFIIGGDGKAYIGRPGYKMGGHTKNHNRKSIGIALIGDFSKDSPGPEMLDLVPKIAYCGVEKGYIHPSFTVIGHRDAYCSSCPGDALYNVVKGWPRFPETVPIPSYTCDTTGVTSVTTTKPTTPTPTTDTTTVATTTESTTTPTTTEVATTTENSSTTDAMPIFYYVVMAKKPLSPDALNKILSLYSR